MRNTNTQRISPRIASRSQDFQFSRGTNHLNNDNNNNPNYYPSDSNHLPVNEMETKIHNNFNTSNNSFGHSIDPATVFYIQKLDSMYHSLEGRVLKLEAIVADQIRNHRTSSNVLLDSTLPSFSNPSSTGSSIASSIAPSDLFGVVPSGPISQKEISKSDLDDFCLPLLQRKATPSIGELNLIVMNMKATRYPEIDNRAILSKVREWFRRKREYMSQRIFNICSKKYPTGSLTRSALDSLRYTLKSDHTIPLEIVSEANLEIVNEMAAVEFCTEKVFSYLENFQPIL